MLLPLLPACGARSDAGQARAPTPSALADPLDIYRELGFLTGSSQFPAVASFATLAGPADSTHVVLALSLPNSALRFQREGGGFYAEYVVNVAFVDRDSVIVKRHSHRETVRIPTFDETGRTDESVIHQQVLTVAPGEYIVRVEASDANSSRGSRMTDTLVVPTFAAASALSSPMVVYSAAGRGTRDLLPELIANPRHTVAYGGQSPIVYFEAYGATATRPVPVRVVNDTGEVLWSGTAAMDGAGDVYHAIVEIPSTSLPLGLFAVEIGAAGDVSRSTPLLLTISDQWMVANFDDMLQFLRYIARPSELDSLRTGSTVERRDAWDRFWERRDPLPVTATNEFRDQFFERVRFATQVFREPGSRGGWSTDRGEVYIVLGPPSYVLERWVSGGNEVTHQANAEEWIYDSAPGGGLRLLFYDRNGFGRYELVPTSVTAFRMAAERLKP